MPKILIADDSIAVRKVAERLLVGAGLEVVLAANGEEAVAWLTNERPDLIISDVIMSDKSGYDVCGFVRSHPTLSDTPVLLISGIVNEEVTRQAESCRADGVLKKPFQGTSLQDRVLELLAKRQAQPAGPAAPSVSATSSFAATSAPASSKVYRITEEQLQAFRQATSRIKELETILANEQTRSERLIRQLETASQAEALLAQEQERSVFLLQRIQEAERAVQQADERLDAATRALAEIARLATQRAKADTPIRRE